MTAAMKSSHGTGRPSARTPQPAARSGLWSAVRSPQSAVVIAGILIGAACSGKKTEPFQVQAVPVERRTIVVEVEATGVVEPINVVEVKSKSSGQIVRMPVETGSNVKPGDLLVQLDTRDVKNQYDQTLADVRAAEANLAVSAAQKRRSDTLFAQQIITAQEHETASLAYANAQAQAVRGRTNLDLAQQRLEDATVRAPIAGTVIEKLVSLGQVIASGTNALGGGTALLKMADLNSVRARVLVTETDIGQVQPGQTARVMVDAYPTRPFQGVVEKIEPQAVVQQSVTMFPVLVTLSNREGLLKPGMNGEVSILVNSRDNVLAVPNDAVRSVREAAAVATTLGLDPADVQGKLQAQMGSMGGGNNRTRQGGQNGQRTGGNVTKTMSSPGTVAESVTESEPRGAQGRMQMPDVTDAQCAQVRAVLQKNPAAEQKLASIRERTMAGELDRQTAREESQKVYAELKIEAPVAMACRFRERGGQAGAAPGGNTGGASSAPTGASRSATSAPAAPAGRVTMTAGRDDPMAQSGGVGVVRPRSGLVFVGDSGKWEPRVVMLGVSNYDFTEVISGVKEGEKVALLGAAAMQMQRQQMTDRMRSMSGVPGMSAPGGGRPSGGQQQRPAGGTPPR